MCTTKYNKGNAEKNNSREMMGSYCRTSFPLVPIQFHYVPSSRFTLFLPIHRNVRGEWIVEIVRTIALSMFDKAAGASNNITGVSFIWSCAANHQLFHSASSPSSFPAYFVHAYEPFHELLHSSTLTSVDLC